MIHYIYSKKWTIVGISIGAVLGWAYWYYIGCLSGTCPLQSQWPYTTAYGALLGAFAFGYVDDYKNKKIKENEN